MLSLWFLHSRFDPRRAQFYFSKNKLTERSLKCACHSVDWMVTEWWLKCDWNPPFPSPFSRHSATIQSPFSRLKGEISSCVSKSSIPLIACRTCMSIKDVITFELDRINKWLVAKKICQDKAHMLEDGKICQEHKSFFAVFH